MGDSGSWKKAIVIGASSGIGEEMADQLAAAGCKLALAARREDALQAIADRINAKHGAGTASIYPHDVRSYDEIPGLFVKMCRDLDGLDLFVYSSGVMPLVAGDEYDFAKDRSMLEINAVGAVAWINEAARRFGKAEAGTIVALSSVAGERGRYSGPVYGMSKAALNIYMEAIRNRVARHGVKVVNVKLGPTHTPMTEGLKLPFMINSPEAVTKILEAARRGTSNPFIPGIWRWIFLLIRNIPSFVFRKLKF